MNSYPLIIVGGFLLLLLLFALGFGFLMQRRRGNRSNARQPSWMEALSPPPVQEGERMASIISEQIEEVVRIALQKDPSLQDMQVDFGTADDGTLEIWIDDSRYTSVDEIPDERIRLIIQNAVAAYNQGDG